MRMWRQPSNRDSNFISNLFNQAGIAALVSKLHLMFLTNVRAQHTGGTVLFDRADILRAAPRIRVIGTPPRPRFPRIRPALPR